MSRRVRRAGVACLGLVLALLAVRGLMWVTVQVVHGNEETEDPEKVGRRLAHFREAGLRWAEWRRAAPGTPGVPDWWFPDNPLRDTSRLTAHVLKHLEVKPGMAVADVGAGAGYFTFRLAERVGPTGRVLATDTDPTMALRIEGERVRRGVGNVVVRLAHRSVPRLAPDTFERMLLVNVFPFAECRPIQNRRFLKAAAAALAPGGRLIVADDRVLPRLRTADWTGAPRECGGLQPRRIAVTAAPWFEPIAIERLRPRDQEPVPAEESGFVLVLEKRGSVAGAWWETGHLPLISQAF